MLGGYFSGRTSENLGYAKFVLHTAVYAYTSEDIGPATVAPPFGAWLTLYQSSGMAMSPSSSSRKSSSLRISGSSSSTP